MKSKPSLQFETPLWAQNHIVIGIDEVGRGALAGPLTFGAVCFDPRSKDLLEQSEINDSKVLSASKRGDLSQFIQHHAYSYTTASCPAEYIDEHGLTQATYYLIQEVLDTVKKNLPKQHISVLLDGTLKPSISGIDLQNIHSIIDGDALSISIAAASIIAKVERDTYMQQIAPQYLVYQWDKNKGYGTRDHREALKRYGPSPLHRKLFIRNIN